MSAGAKGFFFSLICTFVFDEKWMVESAFGCQHAVVRRAGVKGQLENGLAKGHCLFVVDQLQPI